MFPNIFQIINQQDEIVSLQYSFSHDLHIPNFEYNKKKPPKL